MLSVVIHTRRSVPTLLKKQLVNHRPTQLIPFVLKLNP